MSLGSLDHELLNLGAPSIRVDIALGFAQGRLRPNDPLIDVRDLRFEAEGSAPRSPIALGPGCREVCPPMRSPRRPPRPR